AMTVGVKHSNAITQMNFILTPQQRRPHPLGWGGAAYDNYISIEDYLQCDASNLDGKARSLPGAT
uniref:hypothetical protein n=1 Tax=Mesotoga prima TaxID=1184387 RepID=UPI002FDB40F8